jgi:hypothetical protein
MWWDLFDIGVNVALGAALIVACYQLWRVDQEAQELSEDLDDAYYRLSVISAPPRPDVETVPIKVNNERFVLQSELDDALRQLRAVLDGGPEERAAAERYLEALGQEQTEMTQIVPEIVEVVVREEAGSHAPDASV